MPVYDETTIEEIAQMIRRSTPTQIAAIIAIEMTPYIGTINSVTQVTKLRLSQSSAEDFEEVKAYIFNCMDRIIEAVGDLGKIREALILAQKEE
jgi:hypothetical protein